MHEYHHVIDWTHLKMDHFGVGENVLFVLEYVSNSYLLLIIFCK